MKTMTSKSKSSSKKKSKSSSSSAAATTADADASSSCYYYGPSSMDMSDFLHDKELCAALGMFPDSGCCIRHPNVTIMSSSTTATTTTTTTSASSSSKKSKKKNKNGSHKHHNSSNNNNAKPTTRDFVVQCCRICESEFLAGGLRQRRSFAYAILQVQKLHNDPVGWKQFKRHWDSSAGTGSGQPSSSSSPSSFSSSSSSSSSSVRSFYAQSPDTAADAAASAETKEYDNEYANTDDEQNMEDDDDDDDESNHGIPAAASKQQQQQKRRSRGEPPPLRFDRYKPSSILKDANRQQIDWKEYSWQIVLRTIQVQEWAMVEKDKELALLRAQLRQQQQQLATANTNEQRGSFQDGAFMDGPNDDDNYNCKTAASLNGGGGGGGFTMTEDTKEDPPRYPSRKSSLSDLTPFNKFAADAAALLDDHTDNTTTPTPTPLGGGEYKFEGAPKLPQRQASNDVPICISPIADRSSDTGDTNTNAMDGPPIDLPPIGRNSNRGFGRLLKNNHQGNKSKVPPTLPTRQASTERLLHHRQQFQNQQRHKRNSNLSSTSELTSPSLFSAISTDSAFTYDSALFMSGSTTNANNNNANNNSQYADTSFYSDDGGGGGGDISALTRSEISSRDSVMLGTIISEDGMGDDTNNDYYKATSYSASLKEGVHEDDDEDDDNDDDDDDVNSNHDISFLPPTLEQPPPPPTSPPPPTVSRQDSIVMTTPATTMTKTNNTTSMKEIQFDGSQELRYGGPNVRRSSITEMEFGAKDKLLQEASLALATPHSIAGRRLKTTSDFKKSLLLPVPTGVVSGDRATSNSSSATPAATAAAVEDDATTTAIKKKLTQERRATSGRYSGSFTRGKLAEEHRPVSADDVLLSKTEPILSGVKKRSETILPGRKNGMKLGEFFDNHNNNNSSGHTRDNDDNDHNNNNHHRHDNAGGGDDEDDEAEDEFGNLPVDSGFIRVPERSGSLSPVSCVTMLTTDPTSLAGGGSSGQSPEEEEEMGPKKGLQNRGTARLLPMEEGFNSDDEESTQVSSKLAPTEAEEAPETMEVVDQIVNDRYGDSGLYTGSVSAKGLVPHGTGGTILFLFF
eukprot:scaffold7696_cov141-Cylindrotheca_fusiformis.AAC.8